jgi:hypothetical protein
MPSRRPPRAYFALIAVLALDVAILAIPGGPYVNPDAGVGTVVVSVALLAALGLGSKLAWWLLAVTTGLGAFSGLTVPLVMGVNRLDDLVWLLGPVVFVLLLTRPMRRHVRLGQAAATA